MLCNFEAQQASKAVLDFQACTHWMCCSFGILRVVVEEWKKVCRYYVDERTKKKGVLGMMSLLLNSSNKNLAF